MNSSDKTWEIRLNEESSKKKLRRRGRGEIEVEEEKGIKEKKK